MHLSDSAQPARPADTKHVEAIDCEPALLLPYPEDYNSEQARGSGAQ